MHFSCIFLVWALLAAQSASRTAPVCPQAVEVPIREHDLVKISPGRALVVFPSEPANLQSLTDAISEWQSPPQTIPSCVERPSTQLLPKPKASGQAATRQN